jgi:hypothetical protein
MWASRILLILISLAGTTTLAQPGATPTPTPRPGARPPDPAIAENYRFDRLRAIDLLSANQRAHKDHPLLDPKKGIYRKPSKQEIAVLAVAQSLLQEYAAFLNLPNTGIVKLNAESSCVSDTGELMATEKCLPFGMPGAGTAYSFRTKTYRIPRLADLILLNNTFTGGGVLQQVIMADLGDLAIAGVTLDTSGVKFLTGPAPVSDSEQFIRFDSQLVHGIAEAGLLYRKWQPVKENSTFVLRSTAYRGQYLRSIDGVAYDELAFDKRRDVIVAFRVVERDVSGNLTILWKCLSDVESPKLIIKK